MTCPPLLHMTLAEFVIEYFCNPINFTYQYQFNQKGDGFSLNREAADPSMILFKGKYYLFPSMTRGFLVSRNMVNWKWHPLEGLPVYDYAPDVRAVETSATSIVPKILKAAYLSAFQVLSTSGIPICSWTMTDECIFTGDAAI